ncbi:MAG: hypothetical protein AAF517_17370 [Planctomycetota bacterium]
MNSSMRIALLFGVLASSRLSALELVQTCDADREICAEDSLEIFFPASKSHILRIDGAGRDATVELEVHSETVSEGIRGWSYGVVHDVSVLEIESLTIEGTTAEERSIPPGFHSTVVVERGFISAIVLSFLSPAELPIGRNALVRATYRLLKDPGLSGTVVGFEDEFPGPENPPLQNGLQKDEKFVRFGTTIDGWILGAGAPTVASFQRGDLDADGRAEMSDVLIGLRVLFGFQDAEFDCDDAADTNDDGRVDVSDAVTQLRWLFLGGGELACPFGVCGFDGTGDTLGCDRSPEGCEG